MTNQTIAGSCLNFNYWQYRTTGNIDQLLQRGVNLADNWTAGKLDTFGWLFHFWDILLIFEGGVGAELTAY